MNTAHKKDCDQSDLLVLSIRELRLDGASLPSPSEKHDSSPCESVTSSHEVSLAQTLAASTEHFRQISPLPRLSTYSLHDHGAVIALSGIGDLGSYTFLDRQVSATSLSS